MAGSKYFGMFLLVMEIWLVVGNDQSVQRVQEPFYDRETAMELPQDDTECQERSGVRYTSPSTAEVDVRFPSIHTEQDDQYLCTGFELPFQDQAYSIVKFTPHADMSHTHHMLVYGCATLNSAKPYWKCGLPCPNPTTIFAWARNAPELSLPKDVGFSIGKGSNIRYIVVNMHFAKAFREGSCAGVTAHVTRQTPKYFAGIYLMGAFDINLPPHSANVASPVSCVNKLASPMHVFAFRTHAHDLANVITGYRYRDNAYKMIGKGNPKWPQSFYPRVGGEIVLRSGDIVIAQCDYNNTRDVRVTAGATSSDEMCNMYLMFYTSDENAIRQNLNCWGMNADVEIPDTADDLAPYPGYAGQDSVDAVMNGEATIPAVPMEHHHHHHEEGDENDEPILTDDEIEQKLAGLSNATKSRSHGMPRYQGLLADLSYPQMQAGYVMGQVGGVAAAADGSVYVFHRADRTWNARSFDRHERFTQPDNPIKLDTIYHLDSNRGSVLHSWGAGQFFMPHGASLDHRGNLWLTDVAMHQVFKYPANGAKEPTLSLGVRMVPGSDVRHFCKPTDIAVDEEGTIFVSDGYCNGRVIKFSPAGEFIRQWGRAATASDFSAPDPFAFLIPHSVVLAGPRRLEVCVADREHGRIPCFTKDGNLTRVLQDKKKTGTRIFAIAYSPLQGGVIFGVNGPGLLTSEQAGGFTVDWTSGQVVDRWQPAHDVPLTDPHDVSTPLDGARVFVGDLTNRKLFKFDDPSALHKQNNEEKQEQVKILDSPQENEEVDKSLDLPTNKTSSSVALEKGGEVQVSNDESAATIIIVCLIALPMIAIIISVTCMGLRARRMKEYESILSTSKKPKKRTRIMSPPEKQGFKPLSTESTDEDSDVEVYSKNTMGFEYPSVSF